jgi:uncharacterized membrane protein
MIEEVRLGPLATPALVLGIGLGGFVDGIVFHQLLQWHHMMSSVISPDDLVGLRYNTRWDGVFHAVMWLVTLGGIIGLYRAARRDDVVWSWRVFSGAMLFGWGVFNFVEGLIAHLVLGIHHVHPASHQLAWDIGFVAFGVGLMLVGYLVGRSEIAGDRMSPATRRALAL